jgi:excisionase family DNA binding protein
MPLISGSNLQEDTATSGLDASGSGRTRQVEELLRVERVAEKLGLSRSATYELVSAGRIRSLKLGRARRVRSADVDAFIREEAEKQQVALRG